MDSQLSSRESWSLAVLFLVSLGVIANTFQGNGEPLVASLAFSCSAFSLTYSLIRWLGDTFMRANLKGRDMSKVRKVEMLVHRMHHRESSRLIRGQPRDNGGCLRRRISPIDDFVHPLSVLPRYQVRHYHRRSRH